VAEIFDLIKRKAYPYQQRERNVLYKRPEFKARIIELASGGGIAECRMADHVIFIGLEGQATVTIDGQAEEVSQGKCLVGGPGLFSMETESGARLLGIQIKTVKKD